MLKNIEYDFKIIVVGDSGVGKSCLLYQFAENKWLMNKEMTLGVDYYSKILSIENSRVKLKIWDTAGQEKYKSIIKSYYRNSNLAVVVYDITNKESFLSVENWILSIREIECVPFMIVANKTDLSDIDNIDYQVNYFMFI